MAFTQVLLLSLLAACTLAQTQFGGGGGSFQSGAFPSSAFPSSGFGGQQNTFGQPSSFGQQSPYVQQSPFGQPGGQFPTSPFGSRLPGLPFGQGQGFPSFGGQQQNRQGRLATVRAMNKAKDRLYLTLEELPNRQPQNPFFQQSQLEQSGLRVHGIFVKSGAETGVQNPESLHGTFAMVVAENGNTDGYCIGTGSPYRVSAPNPFSANRNNPFSQFFPQQQQQGQIVLVSTPLHANTGTSTIEGRLNGVRLSQIIGRAIHVCGDTECRVKTDLCGVIARDSRTVEEFKQLLAQAGGGQYNPNGGLNNQLGQSGSLGGGLGGVPLGGTGSTGGTGGGGLF